MRSLKVLSMVLAMVFGNIIIANCLPPWTWESLLAGGVEGGDDAQAVALEFLVAHEGRAEVAGPDDDRLVVLIPAEVTLDCLDEFLYRIAFLGLADYAGYGEILSDLIGSRLSSCAITVPEI